VRAVQSGEERNNLKTRSRVRPVATLLGGGGEDFEESWLKAWRLQHEHLPPCLYHYTTCDGLRGILCGHNVWATDARDLDDKGELVYIDEVIRKVVAGLCRRYRTGWSRAFLDAAAEQLLNPARDWFQVYVACFCIEGDKPSQWCEYAQTGYAIGFDPKPMCTQTELRLRRVVYDTTEQEKLVSQVLGFFADWLARQVVAERDSTLLCTAALLEAAHLLSECLFCFKHPSFCEEQEWRLVHIVTQELHQVNTPVRFRQGHNGPASYVELHPNGQPPGVSGRLPIREVVISPNLPAEPTKSMMQSLLEGSGYGDDTRVRNSVISLRV
jgi:hypothetical protein